MSRFPYEGSDRVVVNTRDMALFNRLIQDRRTVIFGYPYVMESNSFSNRPYGFNGEIIFIRLHPIQVPK